MAKTQFPNGSIILPAWINSIFGSGASGGHVHDGVDSDGHCGKIDLYNHVDLSIHSLAMTVTTSYLTNQQVCTLDWAQVGRLVYLFMGSLLGISNGNTLIAALSGSPSLPTPQQSNQYLPCSLQNSSLVVGMVKINTSQFTFYCQEPANDGDIGHWGSYFASAELKGWPDQTLCYFCT